MKKHAVLIVMGALTLMTASSIAKADVNVATRFFGGTPSTNVGIGVAIDGQVYIVEQRVSDGVCKSQIISSQSGLLDNVIFDAGNGNNRVRVAVGGWDVHLCGFTLTNLRSNFKRLQINGSFGDDIIITEGASTADGGPGNDVILAIDTYKFPAGFGQIWGGSGNDVIIQVQANGHSDKLFGADGDDYLCDLGDGAQMLGGAGFDSWYNPFGPLDLVEKQVTQQSCNDLVGAIVLTQPF